MPKYQTRQWKPTGVHGGVRLNAKKKRDWNTQPEKPVIKCKELAERLGREDEIFDRQWRAFWKQRNKWKDFDEFVKNAA